MSAENKFNELIEKFKKDIKDAASEAVDSIHSEMLPYVNDDTWHNAIHRAHDIVSRVLTNNFTVENDEIIVDGWNTKLTTNDHDRLVNKLAEKCADTAMQKKIERLERQLKESYSNNY